jgi:hypothetical protein
MCDASGKPLIPARQRDQQPRQQHLMGRTAMAHFQSVDKHPLQSQNHGFVPYGLVSVHREATRRCFPDSKAFASIGAIPKESVLVEVWPLLFFFFSTMVTKYGG